MADRTTHPGTFDRLGLWLEAPTGAPAVHRDVLDRAGAAASAADGSGIGSVWVSDPVGTVGSGTPYEVYSLLGALAVRSDRVHLGVMADGADRRAPSILSKIVTGIDVLSHGRGVLTLGGDSAAHGDAERLTEALAVCRSVLEDEHPTFGGRIYSIQDAVNRPAPVQVGGVPIVVQLEGNGPGRAALLDVAVRLADVVVVDGGPDGVAEACRAVAEGSGNRRPDERCPVLGRVASASADDGLAASVIGIRAAGATGCLVGVPYPWDPAAVVGLAPLW